MSDVKNDGKKFGQTEAEDAASVKRGQTDYEAKLDTKERVLPPPEGDQGQPPTEQPQPDKGYAAPQEA